VYEQEVSMTDILVIGIILSIIAGASWSIYREKKKGVKCMGCPYAQGSSCKKKIDSETK